MRMGIMNLFAIIIVTSVAYVAYQQWLQHHRRMMIHREQLAAIEKGIQIPALDEEIRRRTWNVQRLLLLAGLCWISVGLGIFIFVSAMHVYHPDNHNYQGTQWLGAPLVLIGLSHLAVFAIGRNREA